MQKAINEQANPAESTGYENTFLSVGDVFTPIKVKTFTTKTYNKTGVSILDVSGKVYSTTASKIVRILTGLTEEQINQCSFEVIQTGVFNGYPVLSLKATKEDINRAIMLLMF